MGVPPGIASELQYFAAAATLIFFLGIKDDILVLSVTKKFIGQLIAAGIIIKFGGVRITVTGINTIGGSAWHTGTLRSMRLIVR